jgi:beta-glucosidase
MRKVAGDSIVLLKNEDSVLPFKKDKKIAVIGPNAAIGVISGGGSASLLPYSRTTPLEGIQAQAADVVFSQGCYGHKKLPLLNHHLSRTDGTKGFTMCVYNTPPGTKDRVAIDELKIHDTFMFLMDYENPAITGLPTDVSESNPTFYADVEGYLTPEETAIWEFSLSVAGTATLFIDDEKVIENVRNQIPGDSFFGAGTIDLTGRVKLEKGKKHKLTVLFGSAPTSEIRNPGAPLGKGGVRVGGCPVLDVDAAIAAAVKVASEVDQVVVVAGLNDDWESEGYDRQNMKLPPYTDELIEKVLKANPYAAVVLQSGTPVDMPWLPQCKALVQAWYGGNEGGNGIADVLLGTVNPSGKLSLTYPKRVQDNPAYLSAKSEAGRMRYGEDVFVGYRHYDILDLDVNFPFGHGLSYTTFSASDLSVKAADEKLSVSVKIENVGKLDGAEVVQVYVSQDSCSITRPIRELKGFKKLLVKAGAKETVNIEIPLKYATSFWDESRDMWLTEKGGFKVHVGNSSRGEFLESAFTVEKSYHWKGL